MLKVDGQEYWTLFDTGVRSTYVVSAVAEKLQMTQTPHPIRAALGGRVKVTTCTALLQAEVQGHLVSTHALVVDEIGKDEDGRRIEILFGALAMHQWGKRGPRSCLRSSSPSSAGNQAGMTDRSETDRDLIAVRV